MLIGKWTKTLENLELVSYSESAGVSGCPWWEVRERKTASSYSAKFIIYFYTPFVTGMSHLCKVDFSSVTLTPRASIF